ncbi:hypothetical protein DKL61_13340 [Gammaproteobacteria bacterium ESL0073]|nr:hypothetical protein DKL61_13340 [Gammaproteobacteria bacterium ESL0073]
MRNDLKDEPISVPSLTIDDVEGVSPNGDFELRNRKKSRFSNGFILSMLLFLFIVYSVGMSILFWVFKQSTDEVRNQLNQTTSSTTQVTEANLVRWQALAKQIADQQATTKTSLEGIRDQNKQLIGLLNKLQTEQKTTAKQQSEQNDRLVKLERQLQSFTQYDEQIKRLTTELDKLKQSQTTITTIASDVKALQDKKLPQAVQSVQDDLLLLRSQLDASANNDSKQQLAKLEKQIQSLQSQVDTLRQQLSNRSLY